MKKKSNNYVKMNSKIIDEFYDYNASNEMNILQDKLSDLSHASNIEENIDENNLNNVNCQNINSKTENYEAAQELYNHFHQFYPSDKQAEYAYYRSILAQFNQTLQADCDQEPTKKTIDLCKEYLNNKMLSAYQQDVADIKKTCEYKLINKEIYVFDFYLHKGHYDAAEKRLAYIDQEFVKEHTELASRLLYLRCKLAEKKQDKEKLQELLNNLDSQYPHSQYTRMAHSMLNKKRYFII